MHLHMGRIFTAPSSNSIISYMILNGENPLKWFSVAAFSEFGLGRHIREAASRFKYILVQHQHIKSSIAVLLLQCHAVTCGKNSF
jgi:hypothetical protein